MSFKNVAPEEYQKLINNKNRIFDMTFKTPEILNKYRDNKIFIMKLNKMKNKIKNHKIMIRFFIKL